MDRFVLVFRNPDFPFWAPKYFTGKQASGHPEVLRDIERAAVFDSRVNAALMRSALKYADMLQVEPHPEATA